MSEYLAEIWRSRYFWLSLVRSDLRNRYRRSVLGIGWSMLHPLVMTGVLCTVFPLILHVDVHTYAPFLLAGLAFWNYLVSVTVSGCQSLFLAESYIRQQPKPLAIYSLRMALGGTLHFFMTLIVVICLTWAVHGLPHPLALISLIPATILFFGLAWSTATIAGFANVFFGDTQHLVEDGFQVMIFLTPVMYYPAILEKTRFAAVLGWNPLVFFLRLIREPLMQGHAASIASFGACAAAVAITATIAGLILRRQQDRLIFNL